MKRDTPRPELLAATGSHFMRGCHFQGTCGAFGAAATAAQVEKIIEEVESLGQTRGIGALVKRLATEGS